MEYIRGRIRRSRLNITWLGRSIDAPPVSHGEIPAYVHSPCEGPGIIFRISGALPIVLAMVLTVLWPSPADAKNHTLAGRKGVSAMVATVLPAVVSITTRRIEYDEFSRPVPKRGLGSGVIVDRRGYILTIDTEGLEPQVLLTRADGRVTFVNRSGKMVHVDFIIRETELHHTVQVPDRIWAVFHRSGRHPYVVHFQDPTAPDLRGVIEVVSDPYGGPDPRVCSGVTVMGACIER